MIHCEITTDLQKLSDYREQWDRLFESGNYESSVSFEWTYALLSTHLKENDSFILMVLKESGNLCGIIPLVINHNRKFGLKTLYP